MRRFACVLITLVVLSACSSTGVPRVTPTVAPTDTPTPIEEGTVVVQVPSRTPIPATATDAPTATLPPTLMPTDTVTPNPSETPTNTVTATNTATDTPTATATATPSRTPDPSETPTLTHTPTRTPTLTNTPLPTNTPRPTATPSPTDTLVPTLTPLPTVGPTDTLTPTATPTLTPTWTVTASPTATASVTSSPVPPTEDLGATDTARIRRTETAIAAVLESLSDLSPTPTNTLTTATPTRLPSPTPTNTLSSVPPTLDATPTFVTAVPDATAEPEDLGIIIGEEPEPQFVPTNTPTPPPTVAISVPIPPTVSLAQIPQPEANTTTGALDFTVGDLGAGIAGIGGLFAQLPGQAEIIPGVVTGEFWRSPVDPSDFVVISDIGLLYTKDGEEVFRPSAPPFDPVNIDTREQNDNFVTDVAWNPNGENFAFIVDGDLYHPQPRLLNDGVWFYDWNTNAMRKLVIDCPYPEHRGCLFTANRSFWSESTDLEWSPDGSTLLVRVNVTRWFDGWEGFKGALLVVPPDQNPEVQPTELIYDYGSWSNDGQRIVVSGRSQHGPIFIGTVNPDGSDERILWNAGEAGWWVQHAVQRSDGQIVALGRPGDRNGPMQIIDQNGNPLTGPIGTNTPENVVWSPDRGAVLIEVEGQRYVAFIDGRVENITDRLAGATAVNWVDDSSSPAPVVGTLPDPAVPQGVIEGSRFGPGQQARVLAINLNLRLEPGTDNDPIGGVFQNEWVAILAGPVENENVEWWYVQIANGQTGWVAGEINGAVTLG